jgi:hypothetical protein
MLRSVAQNWAGTALAIARPMSNFFVAGQELVRWDVERVSGQAGVLRLSMHHGQGTIVEYFETTDAALERERELEALLMSARGFVPYEPAFAEKRSA